MRWVMGAIGVLGIITPLLGWLQTYPRPGVAHGGWPVIVMGTIYLVGGLMATVPWRILAGASVAGLIGVGWGLYGGLRMADAPLAEVPPTPGWLLAVLTVIASLVVLWRMRTVER